MAAEGGGLAQLLSHPGIHRMARDGHVHDPARGQLDNEEGMHLPDEQVGHRQEIAGPDGGGMGAQERSPRLA